MASNEPQQEPQLLHSSPFAPPTQPGPLLAVESPSKWPTVLGVISIVFGVLGILCSVCGLGGALIPSPGSTTSAGHGFFQIVLFILNEVLSVGLLVIGIGLLKHRPWVRWFALTWAAVEATESVITVPISMYQAKEEIAVQAAGGPAPPPALGEGIFYGGTVCGLVFSLALPIFFFVWFSRARIKQAVASWKSAAPINGAPPV